MTVHQSQHSGSTFEKDLRLLTDGALFHYEQQLGAGVDPAAAALHGIVRAWDYLVTEGSVRTPTIHAMVGIHLDERNRDSGRSGSDRLELRTISGTDLADPGKSPLLYLLPSIVENVQLNLPHGDLGLDARIVGARDAIGPSLAGRGYLKLSTSESWRTNVGQELLLGMQRILGAEE